MKWLELNRADNNEPIVFRLTKDTGIMLAGSKDLPDAVHIKVFDEVITVIGTVSDLMIKIDQHLAKEEINV